MKPKKELFAALAKPFKETKTRSAGGKTVTYITARQVMDRLDKVMGPENWTDAYALLSENPITVQCTLSLRIDGEWLAKQDVGTENTFEPVKASFSDALKRAAVRWGIGRYLYEDGEGSTFEDLKAELELIVGMQADEAAAALDAFAKGMASASMEVRNKIRPLFRDISDTVKQANKEEGK